MFPKEQIDGFEKYWRRRKPGSSTALHYASDVRIFFKWAEGQPPEAITVHDVDEFIGWQQDLGRAQATIRRRLIALRMFYDYLAYAREEGIDNPVITQRHYIDQGHRLPRDIRQSEITVRRSTRQLFNRLNHITTFFIQHYEWSEWQQLAPHWLEDYIDARLREGISPSTINWGVS